MSEHSYTEQVALFRETVEQFSKSLDDLRSDMRKGFQDLNNKIDNVKQDSDTIIEGIPKHGVKPLRDEIDLIRQVHQTDIDKANDRIENIEDTINKVRYTAMGYGAGSGVGLFGILKVIFG